MHFDAVWTYNAWFSKGDGELLILVILEQTDSAMARAEWASSADILAIEYV